MKRLISFFFAMFIVFGIFSLQAGAANTKSSDKVLVQGGLTEEEKNMNNEDFLNQALSRPGITKEENKKSSKKTERQKQFYKTRLPKVKK